MFHEHEQNLMEENKPCSQGSCLIEVVSPAASMQPPWFLKLSKFSDIHLACTAPAHDDR